MSRLGIANTMRLAYSYNRLKFHRQDRWRTGLYQTQLATLLEENGGLSRPPIEMKDGWALDTSMSLPHLDRVLRIRTKLSPNVLESGVRPRALIEATLKISVRRRIRRDIRRSSTLPLRAMCFLS